jgi:hypothetical protein
MPNWCHNNLEVIGLEDEILAFVNKARELPKGEEHPQPLFFANFVPEPDYDEGDEVMPGWWNWRVENWGCKWEPNFEAPFMALGLEGSDPGAEKEKLDIQALGDGQSLVTYEFDTPWGPPGPVFDQASKQHPNLFFRLVWGEPGGDFGGKCEWKDGETVHFEEGEASDYLPEEKMWF